ncbi:MAG: AMP-binding protein [Cyanobacteria bacterium J06598_3]
MAAIALDGLTPEAVWAGLRPDWLVEEWGVGSGEWGVGSGEWRVESGEKRSAINQQWFEQVARRRQQLENHPLYASQSPNPLTPYPPLPTPYSLPPTPLVLIAEANPADALAGVLAAALAGWSLALANPRWGRQEWTSLGQLIAPDVIWGKDLLGKENSLKSQNSPVQPPRLATTHPPVTDTPAILIPTGGSSGQVKLTHHTWASLMASVTGFRQYFAPNGEPIHTYCVLPVHHVSGLMQVLRAWTSHAQVTLIPFKTLETTPFSLPPFPTAERDQPLSLGNKVGVPHSLLPTPYALLPTPHSSPPAPFISLVPTQLHRLLQANKGPWLSQFQAVLLGGAPPWPALLARAAQHHISLYLSYGMTETAAMVTAFRLGPLPSQAAPLSSGKALPHATIEIIKNGKKLAPGDIGQVVVHSSAIAQGYYSPSGPPSGPPSGHPSGQLANQKPSANFLPGTFYTDDLGYLSTEGHLYITGRASSKIISGGENIFPAEVEAALRGTHQVKDVCIIGQAHEQWGEVVTAIYVPIHENISPETLKQALSAAAPHTAPALSHYKHPKCWIALKALPRNEQGKLNRVKLLKLIQTQSNWPASPVAQRSADGGDAQRR